MNQRWYFCLGLSERCGLLQVRLVCMLLDTCGGYFHKGSAARKLDRFLAFFQRYILAKPSLPLDIDFDVQVPGLFAWKALDTDRESTPLLCVLATLQKMQMIEYQLVSSSD